MSWLPIGEYALLSDRHSAALVSSGDSVDRLCMPRFDSPSIFAAILDDEAGHWSIRPDTEFRGEREHVAGNLVLLRTFHTSAGTLELRDALVLGDAGDPHSLGKHAPHLLARTATCTRGSIDVVMSFRARPEYGLVAPVTTAVDGGLVAMGGANLLTLSSTVPLEVKHVEANARFELGSGERTCFALQYSPLGAATQELRTGSDISALVDETVSGWQEWSELHQSYQGPWRDPVHLSGPVQQALSYQPMADSAAARWYQPDNGIWEVCGESRHFVHSKVMCWVALDRAITLADLLGARDHVEAWKAAAEEIRAAVETQGWDEDQRSYTQSFGSPDLDATVRLLPIVGFLPPNDPRVLSSIDSVREQLTDARGLVHRYHTGSGVDGLDGQEGTFLLCTFWLAHALALAGRVAEGTEVFERAAGYANDLGLLGEEVDSTTGELLGNFPQAFSHIGLVGAAWALSQAGRHPSAGEV
jgi:GH15 family glucan-1,4-alpha-glucosidase